MALLDQPVSTSPGPASPASLRPSRPADLVRVEHLPAQRRFVLHVGARRAGFTEYFEAEGRRAFVHTEVGQPFTGRGLASVLVRAAMTTTRADGLQVVALCPYVRRWVEGHPGYEDLVVAPRP